MYCSRNVITARTSEAARCTGVCGRLGGWSLNPSVREGRGSEQYTETDQWFTYRNKRRLPPPESAPWHKHRLPERYWQGAHRVPVPQVPSVVPPLLEPVQAAGLLVAPLQPVLELARVCTRAELVDSLDGVSILLVGPCNRFKGLLELRQGFRERWQGQSGQA